MSTAVRWRMRSRAFNRWREVLRRRQAVAIALAAVVPAVALTLAVGLVLAAEPRAALPTPTGITKPATAVAPAPLAYFNWFEYTGRDSQFDHPLPAGSYRNPVLAGFYPD